MKSVKAEAEKWGTRARGHEVGERAIYISIPKVSVVWGSAAFIRGPCAFTAAGNAYRLPHTACFVTANVRALLRRETNGCQIRLASKPQAAMANDRCICI